MELDFKVKLLVLIDQRCCSSARTVMLLTASAEVYRTTGELGGKLCRKQSGLLCSFLTLHGMPHRGSSAVLPQVWSNTPNLECFLPGCDRGFGNNHGDNLQAPQISLGSLLKSYFSTSAISTYFDLIIHFLLKSLK